MLFCLMQAEPPSFQQGLLSNCTGTSPRHERLHCKLESGTFWRYGKASGQPSFWKASWKRGLASIRLLTLLITRMVKPCAVTTCSSTPLLSPAQCQCHCRNRVDIIPGTSLNGITEAEVGGYVQSVVVITTCLMDFCMLKKDRGLALSEALFSAPLE